MAKKKTKKRCTGSLQLSFPDYITRAGTCRNSNGVEPGQPEFEPLDVFWHRDKLDSKCDDSKVHTISGAIFLDEHGKTVATESHHPHTPVWGTLGLSGAGAPVGHDVVLYAGLFCDGKVICNKKARQQLFFATVRVRKDPPKK